MQALASSRGVRVAPLRAASQQQQQQSGRVVVAQIARSSLKIASRTNAVGVTSAPRRPTTPPRTAFVVAAAASASNNVPLVTRDEGPISEEAFSVR